MSSRSSAIICAEIKSSFHFKHYYYEFNLSSFFHAGGSTRSLPVPDLVGLVSRLQPWLRWPRGRLLSLRLVAVLLVAADVAAVPIVGLGILP